MTAVPVWAEGQACRDPASERSSTSLPLRLALNRHLIHHTPREILDRQSPIAEVMRDCTRRSGVGICPSAQIA